MTMDALDIAVFIIGGLSVGAYICRLDPLLYWRHKPAIVLMHMALCIASGAAMATAWQGGTGVLEVAAVIGAALWIVVSAGDWRQRVPQQFESRPAPLEHEKLRCVSGGRRGQS